MEQIILSGNCNWCTEAMYQRVKGVVDVTPGTYNITIAELAFSPKDRVEALFLRFNQETITLEEILDIFFISHNPSLVSWQREDCFYPLNRSGIIVESEELITRAEARLNEEKLKNSYEEAIKTKIIQMEMDNFKEGFLKDKNYYKNNPNDGFCQSIVKPRIEKMEQQLPHLLKK